MKRDRLLIIGGILIIALLTIARIRMVNALPDQGYFGKYSMTADQILAGKIPRQRLLDFSPLYLWFVVALRAMHIDFRAVQIVLVSVAAVLVAIAARRFGTIAVMAAPILLLGSRAALVCATDLEPETLILVFNSAALACLGLEVSGSRGLDGDALRDRETARLRYLSGLFLGLSATCRPVAILAAIGLAIACRSWRIIAGAIVPITVLLIVNYSLTREFALMDPGTVFYEGMNPNATGYEGVQPRIVNDLERQSSDPDYLHVAYRIVAARALGHPVTRAESNRYWTGKAFAFMQTYPMAALRLTARKFYFAVHSYDAYDLVTMARKNFLLAPRLFIPFGAMVALAIAAILLRSRGIAPLVVFTCAAAVPLVIFYVTARQRNALLPPLVVLAAAGIAEIAVWRRAPSPAAERPRAAAPTLAVAILISILLGIDGPPQREDAAGWLGVRNKFDQAIALEQGGRWGEAEALLQQLEADGYRPIRENRAVSSIAYYRALAAMHLGKPKGVVLQFLERAEKEAPGNEHVLALRGDKQLLFKLHDPMTAQRALSGGM
ncbi:MAG TPA: hypothetical protein VER58_01340 [Thermoanaerobaculia bacterium]|nr:hypothetical protein [Thermoanaerobaculia bacterium]